MITVVHDQNECLQNGEYSAAQVQEAVMDGPSDSGLSTEMEDGL